jgi:hypothetical protein
VRQRSTHPEAWNISEPEFPKYGSTYDKLKFFLRYATLAPSIHNSQPWAFRIQNNNTIELYGDRKRALPVVDPIGRELTISCGTALGYLQITISHFGYKYKTELLSAYDMEKSDKQPLAKISIYDESGSNNIDVKSLQKEDNDRLFGAIPKRRTSRFRFEDRIIPDILQAGFYYIVDKYPQYQDQQKNQEQEPIWLHITEASKEKDALAELVAHGNHLLMSDKHFVNELIQWARPNNNFPSKKNSVSHYALGITNFISRINPYSVKSFQISKKQDEKVHELAATSPVLAILGSYSDRPLDWINTGIALSNILLLASSENVCCSFLNQPIQVPQMRLKLLNIIRKEKGFPQILLRMGYSRQDIRPTPRRDVEETLTK